MNKKLKIIMSVGILILLISVIVIATFLLNKVSHSSTESKNVAEYKLGDTIETDIERITLNNAEFTIKMNTTHLVDGQTNKKTYPETYFTADVYDPEKDINKAYVASKGHTYVAFEFLLENLDRSSIDIGDSRIEIEYKGQNYRGTSIYRAESVDNITWKPYTSSSILLLSGKKYIRGYMDIPVDVENLEDNFILTFSLYNSQNEKRSFSYNIIAEDRKNKKNTEITLE